MKYNWNTIDCSKMDDFLTGGNRTLMFDNNFYGRSMFETLWYAFNGTTEPTMFDSNGPLMAQNMEYDHIQYTRGFDISNNLVELSDSDHYAVHHIVNRSVDNYNGTK